MVVRRNKIVNFKLQQKDILRYSNENLKIKSHSRVYLMLGCSWAM